MEYTHKSVQREDTIILIDTALLPKDLDLNIFAKDVNELVFIEFIRKYPWVLKSLENNRSLIIWKDDKGTKTVSMG